MLHVLRSSGTPDRALRAMFAARKEVFVDLLKWNVPVVAGTYEMDQYDNADATYLVLTDPAGAHLGSARLLRMTGRTSSAASIPNCARKGFLAGRTFAK